MTEEEGLVGIEGSADDALRFIEQFPGRIFHVRILLREATVVPDMPQSENREALLGHPNNVEVNLRGLDERHES